MQYGDDHLTVGVRKIQELLLDDSGNAKTVSKAMFSHYQKMKANADRMQMITALRDALENEDVMFALTPDTYKGMLNFLLCSFSFEKELIERQSVAVTHEREQQNELTQESQRLVSKLLNSKEFTVSLVCLL